MPTVSHIELVFAPRIDRTESWHEKLSRYLLRPLQPLEPRIYCFLYRLRLHHRLLHGRFRLYLCVIYMAPEQKSSGIQTPRSNRCSPSMYLPAHAWIQSPTPSAFSRRLLQTPPHWSARLATCISELKSKTPVSYSSRVCEFRTTFLQDEHRPFSIPEAERDFLLQMEKCFSSWNLTV